MKINNAQRIVLIAVSILILGWAILHILGLKTSIWNYLFCFSYGLIPLGAGLFGFRITRQWEGFHTLLGRAIFFIALGLVSWGLGNLYWSYANFFLHIAVPYPSFADTGYIVAIPCWLTGIILLSRAIGAIYGLRRKRGKLLFGLIPLLIFIISYYLLVIVARHGVLSTNIHEYLKLFFDLAYPTGDITILSSALIIIGLSASYLGGQFARSIIILLAGFIIMYAADFSFSYTTTLNTYYNANIADLLFTIALSCMSFGLLGFSTSKKQ